jgi:hypothetical protein
MTRSEFIECLKNIKSEKEDPVVVIQIYGGDLLELINVNLERDTYENEHEEKVFDEIIIIS